MLKHDQPNEGRPPVPQILWERWALGEVTPEERQLIERSTTAEERNLRRAELLDSNRSILAQYPAQQVAGEIQWRSRQASSRTGRMRRRQLYIALPAAATAALAVTLYVASPFRLSQPASEAPDATLPSTQAPSSAEAPAQKLPVTAALPTPAPADDVRVKGDPRLLLYRMERDSATELADGVIASEGDRIQVKYLAAKARYGVIFSLDGRGSVTLHFPESSGLEPLLVQGEAQSLSHSYELDDAPQFERFYFVTSSSPIDVASVLSSAKKGLDGGDLALLPGQQLTSITLNKGSNR